MKIKDAVILAGGNGSRLFPFTQAINKSLLNVNGKAVIDYPLNTLKQMGIENVSVILGGDHFAQIVNYLKNGERYGMNFNFLFQGEPKGISHAINLCERFITDKFVTILGDNFFEDPIVWNEDAQGAQIVLNKHKELYRFGVASIDKSTGKIIHIEEKPKVLKEQYDNYAITGCYLFDRRFFDFFKDSKPSARGEYEITEIIEKYNDIGDLSYTKTDSLWIDLGTHESIAYINEFMGDKNSVR